MNKPNLDIGAQAEAHERQEMAQPCDSDAPERRVSVPKERSDAPPVPRTMSEYEQALRSVLPSDVVDRHLADQRELGTTTYPRPRYVTTEQQRPARQRIVLTWLRGEIGWQAARRWMRRL